MTINKKSILKKILGCPKCKSDLEYFSDKCVCKSCGSVYPIIDGKFYFREITQVNTGITNFLDKIKYKFKKYDRLYSFLTKVISPVYSHKNLIKKIVGKADIQLNIGSGNTLLGKNIINCDYFSYDNTDVVLDATILPFKTGSVESIINIAVLEHVPKPDKVVKEMHRVLRNNGEILSIVPFIVPFHASPGDYQRFTISGLRFLHSQFREIAQEYIAVLCLLFYGCYKIFFQLFFLLGMRNFMICFI